MTNDDKQQNNNVSSRFAFRLLKIYLFYSIILKFADAKIVKIISNIRTESDALSSLAYPATERMLTHGFLATASPRRTESL